MDNQSDCLTKIYELTEQRFHHVKDEVNKIMKKKKAKIELDVVGFYYKENSNKNGYTPKIIRFRFAEKYFQLGKWEIVGLKELTGNSVVVYPIGDENRQFPEKIWRNDFSCDGCHRKQHRVKLFVIQNKENGELLQMGTKCLSDFVGMKLSSLVNLMEYRESVETMIAHEIEQENDINKNNRFAYINIEKYVALCYLDTINRGFVSKKEAEQQEGLESTSELAYKQYIGEYELKTPLAKRDYDNARKAIQYYLSLESKDEFTRNLHSLLKKKFVARKDIGYIATISNKYLKEYASSSKLMLSKKNARKDGK